MVEEDQKTRKRQ